MNSKDTASRPIEEGGEIRMIGSRYQIVGSLSHRLYSDHWMALDQTSRQWRRIIQLRTAKRDVLLRFSRLSSAIARNELPRTVRGFESGVSTTSIPLPYVVTEVPSGTPLLRAWPQRIMERGAEEGIRESLGAVLPLFRALEEYDRRGIDLTGLKPDHLLMAPEQGIIFAEIGADEPPSSAEPISNIAWLAGTVRQLLERALQANGAELGDEARGVLQDAASASVEHACGRLAAWLKRGAAA